MSVVSNPGFEGGWWRKTYTGQEWGEIFVPQDWVAWWREGLPVPHDPQNLNGYGRPEMQVINAEPPFLEPPRIYADQRALKFFTFYRIHDAGVYQTVTTIPGATYRLTFHAHAWSNPEDDAYASADAPGAFYALAGTAGLSDAQRNFTFMAGVDVEGRSDPFLPTIQWGQGAHIYNVYAAVPSLTFTSTGASTTIILRSNVLWPFKHNDAYMDAVTLEVVETPVECYGEPREDYQRTYNVIPSDATEERAVAIFLEGWRRGRETAGGSYDDAGIGALTRKKARLYDLPPDLHFNYQDFFEVWYPGTAVEFAGNIVYPLRLAYPTTHYPPEITQPFIEGQHGGIDLRASWAVWGDEILAAFDGEVINDTAVYSDVFGYFVLTHTVNGADVFDLRYAHLISPPYVKKGEKVRRGQKLGKADNTGTSTGDHLHFSIYLNGKYIDPEPLIDWPTTPPPPLVQTIRPDGTHGTISLHWTPTTTAGVQNFLQTIRPPAVKVCTSGGGGPQLLQARAWSPNTLLVYRRVENGLDRYNPADAAPFVQRYIADLAGAGFNLSDFSKAPVYLESINEIYECGATQNNIAAVAWDIAFMNAVEATGLNLKAVVYTAPVGNPHVTAADLEPLLPMVAKACAGRHLLGKHCYYASVASQPQFYQESWIWYGGRFSQDDAYFVSKGYRPFWFLAEAGACGATIIYPTTADFGIADVALAPEIRNWPNRILRMQRDDYGNLVALTPLPIPDDSAELYLSADLLTDPVVILNPAAGWKSAGSIQRYRDELVWCNNWYTAWNAANDNRLTVAVPFTTGGWGWESYNLIGSDLDIVTAGLAAVL